MSPIPNINIPHTQAIDFALLEKHDKKPGWTSRPGTPILVENLRFGRSIIHVMFTDPKTGVPTYDYVLEAEQGGGVFLPVKLATKQIGLQAMARPQVKDEEAQKVWAAQMSLYREGRISPEEFLTNLRLLGRVSMEIPRGVAKVGEGGRDAAKREGHEEMQSAIISSDLLMMSCDQTTFSPHLTTHTWGEIDPTQKPSDALDPNEKILKSLTFYDMSEIREMRRSGHLYCQMTLSSIGAFVLDHPDFLSGLKD